MNTASKIGVVAVALLTLIWPIFSHANTFFPNVQVHSGNPATINLAPWVGTTSAVVLLKVTNNGGSNGNLGLRKTGDGGTFTVASTHVGGSGALFVNGRSTYLTGVTDSNGSIDIVGSAFTWTVVLEAYTITSTSTGEGGGGSPLTQDQFNSFLTVSMEAASIGIGFIVLGIFLFGLLFYFRRPDQRK